MAMKRNGKAALAPSGKSLAMGGKSNGKAGEDGKMEQSSAAAGLTRASSEAPEENQKQQEDNEENRKGKSKFRQCFSLDESALLGFSIRSVNDGKIPLFEKWVEMESGSGEGCSAQTIMDDEISFLSSKKREQCLKVYEKLLKTGCTVKLDTIFRGMLTPSEYRAFMKAAEKAAQEAEDAETTKPEEEQSDSESS